MFDLEPAYTRLRLGLVGQRIFAFAIDFFAVSFVAQFIEAFFNIQGGARLLVFTMVWGFNRVFFASGNQSQSWGHFALSLKVVDMYNGRPVGAIELARREGVIFVPLFFLVLSLQSFNYQSALPLFLSLPLVVDIAFAFADNTKKQALHDRFAQTIVILTKRGLALDQRLANLSRTLDRNRRRLLQDEYYQPPRRQRAYREEEYERRRRRY
ncbi:MAG: RDD family protein [Pseudanabaenaceae cyanobacterium SKYGB_i_bin29]|nr:RDD family protein [Pseudanabaenaceae cyanobacterium SKYG29]MDW8421189.1 RDD family protein [Pseudanabaenaceae cyanobacterium SKYGB_i_bin29]